MPQVKKAKKSAYRILCDGREIARGSVVRTPQTLQTPADYVDTRIGTAHSRWMIAPGPWMPFSMVKMSPDNQNTGWQAGYQPSFENIGCFSHIHEWTLGGLGIMAANGEPENPRRRRTEARRRLPFAHRQAHRAGRHRLLQRRPDRLRHQGRSDGHDTLRLRAFHLPRRPRHGPYPDRACIPKPSTASTSKTSR